MDNSVATAWLVSDLPSSSRDRWYFVLGSASLSWHTHEHGPLEGELDISQVIALESPRLSQDRMFTVRALLPATKGARRGSNRRYEQQVYHFQAAENIEAFVEKFREAIRTHGWQGTSSKPNGQASTSGDFGLVNDFCEEGRPVLRGQLKVRTGRRWHTRHVRFVARTSTMEWGRSSNHWEQRMNTGCKAIQILGRRGTRDGFMLRVVGHPGLQIKGPSKADLDLLNERNMEALIEFLSTHMRDVIPRALGSIPPFCNSLGESLCDLLEWCRPGKQGGIKWHFAWGVLVSCVEDDAKAEGVEKWGLQCYQSLCDDSPQKLLSKRSDSGTRGGCCMPIEPQIVIRPWGNIRRTILLQSSADPSAAVVIRLPDAVRLDRWFNALCEAKQRAVNSMLPPALLPVQMGAPRQPQMQVPSLCSLRTSDSNPHSLTSPGAFGGASLLGSVMETSCCSSAASFRGSMRGSVRDASFKGSLCAPSFKTSPSFSASSSFSVSPSVSASPSSRQFIVQLPPSPQSSFMRAESSRTSMLSPSKSVSDATARAIRPDRGRSSMLTGRMSTNWAELSRYVEMLSRDRPENGAYRDVLLPAVKSTHTNTRLCALIRELSYRFLALTLGSDTMPICTSMDHDARWRLYTEQWSTFVLKLVGTGVMASETTGSSVRSEFRGSSLPVRTSSIFLGAMSDETHGGLMPQPAPPTLLVRCTFLCCHLEDALAPQLHSLKVVERAKRLNELVVAMIRWVTVHDQTKACAFGAGLLAWLGAPGANEDAHELPAFLSEGCNRGKRRHIRQLRDLRALCDPILFNRVASFGDVFSERFSTSEVAEDPDRLDHAQLNERERVEQLKAECLRRVEAGDWMPSTTIMSLLPFANETMAFEGLGYVALTALRLPDTQAELLIELAMMGVFDDEAEMRKLARQAVGGYGYGSAETARALLLICVDDQVTIEHRQHVYEPHELRAILVRVWLGSLMNATRGGGDELLYPQGTTLGSFSETARRREDVLECFHHAFFRVCVGISDWRASPSSTAKLLPNGVTEVSSKATNTQSNVKMEGLGQQEVPSHTWLTRRGVLFGARLLLRQPELRDEQRLQLLNRFVHGYMRYTIQMTDWSRTNDETRESIQRAILGLLRLSLDLEAVDAFGNLVRLLQTSTGTYTGISLVEMGLLFTQKIIETLKDVAGREMSPLRLDLRWFPCVPQLDESCVDQTDTCESETLNQVQNSVLFKLLQIPSFFSEKMLLFGQDAARRPRGSDELVQQWERTLTTHIGMVMAEDPDRFDGPKLLILYCHEILNPASKAGAVKPTERQLRDQAEVLETQLTVCFEALLTSIRNDKHILDTASPLNVREEPLADVRSTPELEAYLGKTRAHMQELLHCTEVVMAGAMRSNLGHSLASVIMDPERNQLEDPGRTRVNSGSEAQARRQEHDIERASNRSSSRSGSSRSIDAGERFFGPATTLVSIEPSSNSGASQVHDNVHSSLSVAAGSLERTTPLPPPRQLRRVRTGRFTIFQRLRSSKKLLSLEPSSTSATIGTHPPRRSVSFHPDALLHQAVDDHQDLERLSSQRQRMIAASFAGDLSQIEADGNVIAFFIRDHFKPILLENWQTYHNGNYGDVELDVAGFDATGGKLRHRDLLEGVLLCIIELAMQRQVVLKEFQAYVEPFYPEDEGEARSLVFGSMYATQGTDLRDRALEVMTNECSPISYKFGPALSEDDSLLSEPIFWTNQIMSLLREDNIGRGEMYEEIASQEPDHSTPKWLYYQMLSMSIRLLKLSLKVLEDSGSELAQNPEDYVTNGTRTLLNTFAQDACNKQEVNAFSFFVWLFLGDAKDDYPGVNQRGTLAWKVAEHPEEFELLGLEKSDDGKYREPQDGPLVAIANICKSGKDVLARVESMEKGPSRNQANAAMRTMFSSCICNQKPTEWAASFRQAETRAYNLVYMFREDPEAARTKFREAIDNNGHADDEEREMFQQVLEKALHLYGEHGLINKDSLKATNFIEDPWQLVNLIEADAQEKDERMRLIAKIVTSYMKMQIQREENPVTMPHHTQVLAMMMFALFFEFREGQVDGGEKPAWAEAEAAGATFRALIMQMKTGEGKSIVIAMLAVFVVLKYGLRVHILENNEGLLDRDFDTYKDFYQQFKKCDGNGSQITCAKQIDAESDICYCLKKQNNTFFNKHIVSHGVKEILEQTILIVDEVDDLVINEKPSNLYKKKDEDWTPRYREAYHALERGHSKPPTVEHRVWKEVSAVKRKASDKKEHVDYEKDGEGRYMKLENGKRPKLKLDEDWLEWLNFKVFHTEPQKRTFYSSLCTPYMYSNYRCIFGLTGSVGGRAERRYIRNTYSAVAYEVPQFLDTCGIRGGKKAAINKGVELKQSLAELEHRVCQLVDDSYQSVPVLVIARDTRQMNNLFEKLKKKLCEDKPSEEVLVQLRQNELVQLREADDDGNSQRANWASVINKAGKRHGTGDRTYCQVTVTDKWGGRGHDFSCNDKKTNANGGLLVIATSIPDTREWTQWKGRTARQDNPGQYHVVLSRDDSVFAGDSHLLERFKDEPDDDKKIDLLLDQMDAEINTTLEQNSAIQACGYWLNELCEEYYVRHPREVNAPWPRDDKDRTLREMLQSRYNTGLDLRSEATEKLPEVGLRLKGPPKEWGFAIDKDFGLAPARVPLAVVFVLDVSYSMDESAEGAIDMLSPADQRKSKELKRRAERERAQEGALTISLMWEGGDDLDIHVRTPQGNEINFKHKRADGGELDVDMNFGGNHSNEPVENVFWNQDAPNGTYKWWVVNSSGSHARDFTVQVKHSGRIWIHNGTCRGGRTDGKDEVYPLAPDFDTRLRTCKQCITAIVDEIFEAEDKVAFMSFANDVQHHCDLVELTDDNREGLNRTIDQVRTRGQTAFFKAVNNAVMMMEDHGRQEPDCNMWVIALTDGRDTHSETDDVANAERLLKRTSNLNLALITLGREVDLDKIHRLKAAAEGGGNIGKHVEATDLDGVREAFSSIAQEMADSAGAVDDS